MTALTFFQIQTLAEEFNVISAFAPNGFLIVLVGIILPLLGITAVVYALVLLRRISRDLRKIAESKSKE
ncbi:MAG: hypothetical protein KF916_00855 [Microbacteriaceae bacterium]|nr:hypothetical protein [Microbacteriaceae bacterium]